MNLSEKGNAKFLAITKKLIYKSTFYMILKFH